MESSVTPLNHYFESQVLQSEGHIQQQSQQQQQQQQILPQQIQQLQQQQPTTSNLRQTIHIHNNQQVQITSNNIANNLGNNIVNGISSNNCIQPQVQHVFSQPSNTQNFGLNNSQQTVFVTNSIPTPSTTTTSQFQPLPEVPPSIQTPSQPIQNPYQFKCSLLEYHIHEAVLINKALRSELQVYKEKIEFEKKLRALLIERVKNYSS